VLLAHGSALDPQSGAPAFLHAAELRRRGLFAEVREAFWKQSPQVSEVLTRVQSPTVFIVPLFLSEGFFSDELIPRELNFRGSPVRDADWRHQRRAAQSLFYCRPIGTHAKMADVVLARAREAGWELRPAQTGAPANARAWHNAMPLKGGAPLECETTLFIVGHGTEQNQNSRAAVEEQARRIQSLGYYAAVHAVFLEEEPLVSSCYEMAQTSHLIVVPYFLSDGLHVRRDIPVMLGQLEREVQQRLQAGEPAWTNPTERHGKFVWYSSSVGTAPEVAEVILDRVKQAAKFPALG
jgi:sirohydrochlorin cobaltochelatase